MENIVEIVKYTCFGAAMFALGLATLPLLAIPYSILRRYTLMKALDNLKSKKVSKKTE